MYFAPYIISPKPATAPLLGTRSSTGLVLDQNITANPMPMFDATGTELTKIDPTSRILPEMGRHSMPHIRAPRGAPSTISAERFLKSRISLSPEFVHNEAATRVARTSNLYAETPRFRNEVDILA
mgnify:CR=1 FL=1|tara:strand:+ start:1378 stop:1752 length:375 start_codon:yes stop_codon:yes gene_type:complete